MGKKDTQSSREISLENKISKIEWKLEEEMEITSWWTIATVVFIILFIGLGIFWMVNWFVKITDQLPPQIMTGTTYTFDTKAYAINSDVYKLNADMTLSKKVLKGIYAREWGIMYYVEDCGIKEWDDWYDENDNPIHHKWYKCDSGEEVKYIWHTEKEAKSSFCNE